MKKNFKHSTGKKKHTKSSPSPLIGNKANGSMHENLAVDMKIWYNENPDALTLQEYFIARDILEHYENIHDWCKQNTKLDLAFKAVKRLLGVRREKLMLHNKINSMVALKMQSHYEPEWRAQEQYKAQLRNQEVPQTQVVVLSDWAKPKIDKSEE